MASVASLHCVLFIVSVCACVLLRSCCVAWINYFIPFTNLWGTDCSAIHGALEASAHIPARPPHTANNSHAMNYFSCYLFYTKQKFSIDSNGHAFPSQVLFIQFVSIKFVFGAGRCPSNHSPANPHSQAHSEYNTKHLSCEHAAEMKKKKTNIWCRQNYFILFSYSFVNSTRVAVLQSSLPTFDVHANCSQSLPCAMAQREWIICWCRWCADISACHRWHTSAQANGASSLISNIEKHEANKRAEIDEYGQQPSIDRSIDLSKANSWHLCSCKQWDCNRVSAKRFGTVSAPLKIECKIELQLWPEKHRMKWS